MHIEDNHFADIIHFLTMGMTPEGYTNQQEKELVVHGTYFTIIAGHLYKMGSDEILGEYVPEFECSSILAKALGGAVRGHFIGKATA